MDRDCTGRDLYPGPLSCWGHLPVLTSPPPRPSPPTSPCSPHPGESQASANPLPPTLPPKGQPTEVSLGLHPGHHPPRCSGRRPGLPSPGHPHPSSEHPAALASALPPAPCGHVLCPAHFTLGTSALFPPPQQPHSPVCPLPPLLPASWTCPLASPICTLHSVLKPGSAFCSLL